MQYIGFTPLAKWIEKIKENPNDWQHVFCTGIRLKNIIT